MPNELIPMSTWTPKDGQTYEIVDKDARRRITDLEEHGGGGTGSGTVKSVNNVEPDSNGNVTLSASDVHALPDSYVAPVTSVNGQTGDVVIEAGGGEGTVKSVNNIEPDASGNVTLSIPEAVTFMTASEIDAMWGNIDGLPDGDEVSY